MLVRLKIKKVQYDNNKEPAKTSALSLGKIDKYEFLTGKEILSSDQSRIIQLSLHILLLATHMKNN